MPRKLPLLERFWKKVNKTDGCWLWTGALRPDGYARMGIEKKMYYVHRVSWQLTRGAIPPNMNALHRCDVKHCVNPKHLYIGTDKDNCRDRQQRNPVDPERRPNAVMTWEKVFQLRNLHSRGTPTTTLSRLFGIDIGHTWRIAVGQLWKNRSQN